MKLPQDAMNEIISFLPFKDVWRLRTLNRQVAHLVLTDKKTDQRVRENTSAGYHIEAGFSECAERNELRIQRAITFELISDRYCGYSRHEAGLIVSRFSSWVFRNLAIRKLVEMEREANEAPKLIEVDSQSYNFDYDPFEQLDEELSKSRFVLDRFSLL